MLEIKTVTNGTLAMRDQHVCHNTLPWLISVSLGYAETLKSEKVNMLYDVRTIASIYLTYSFLPKF